MQPAAPEVTNGNMTVKVPGAPGAEQNSGSRAALPPSVDPFVLGPVGHKEALHPSVMELSSSAQPPAKVGRNACSVPFVDA